MKFMHIHEIICGEKSISQEQGLSNKNGVQLLDLNFLFKIYKLR